MPRKEVVWHYTDQEQEQVDRLQAYTIELEQLEAIKEKRNDLISEMLDGDFTTRQLAEISGLNHVSVSRLRKQPQSSDAPQDYDAKP